LSFCSSSLPFNTLTCKSKTSSWLARFLLTTLSLFVACVGGTAGLFTYTIASTGCAGAWVGVRPGLVPGVLKWSRDSEQSLSSYVFSSTQFPAKI
jgi:hypothetical protein